MFKSRVASMASTSKHLTDDSVFDILNDSDECLISDSSDDSDNCEDDIAVADAAVDEDSQAEEEGQGHSLGDTDYNRDFIWEDMDNYNGHVLFSANSEPQNSAVNVQDIVSVFLLYFSRHSA
jgi:hypothetical protein